MLEHCFRARRLLSGCLFHRLSADLLKARSCHPAYTEPSSVCACTTQCTLQCNTSLCYVSARTCWDPVRWHFAVSLPKIDPWKLTHIHAICITFAGKVAATTPILEQLLEPTTLICLRWKALR